MYVYSQYSIAWSDFGTNGTSYIGTATSGANCFTFTNGQSGSGTKWLVEDKQVTVSHNSNGTLTLPIYWHWGVNSPWGQYTGPSGSYNVTLSTIDRVAPTVTFSVSSITASGFKISANSTAIADIWQYSINGGSTWTTFSTAASTSANVTLSSLSPNTSYTVRVRARRQYNHVYGTSGSSTVKTLGGAVVNSVNTVTADNATVSITINVTVYEASYTNTLVLKNGSATILTISGLSWSKGTANRTVTLTSAQRTTLLNAMASIKSFTVSYKVHKTIYKPTEEHQIIPNMQEPIISEEQWLRVQELRQHRRRPTSTGSTSLFSGLVYCPDCGAKLHFCAAKSLKRNQEFWRCSNYKDGRGTCKIHYIRDVVLEKIVFEAISGLADFVKCHETVFLYMLAKKTNAMRKKEYKRLQQSVEQGTRRIAEIDRLIEKVFEQNATGILSDERFSKMLQSYEKEQKALIQEVADSQQTLQETEQKVTDLRLLLRTLREMTDITKLTPTLVNSLIECIEVHNNDKSSGHCYVKVDIYFTAAGMIDIPTEQEILAMMEEIRANPQDFRFVA